MHGTVPSDRCHTRDEGINNDASTAIIATLDVFYFRLVVLVGQLNAFLR